VEWRLRTHEREDLTMSTHATIESNAHDPAGEAPAPRGNAFTAALYDPFVWLGERLGMRSRRRRLVSSARGRVLEIGAGTGLNLRHYPDSVDELVLAEPVESMAAHIDASARGGDTPVSVVHARAEELPFGDDSFDTVVSTLVLCTVGDPERAVAEVRRVLRPGGRFLFCEHVRADSRRLARWQERLAGPWALFADGCRCDRETLETISGQLSVESVEKERWCGMPAIVRPLVTGAATVTG
jgi:SAM-dependent methyltransferase